MSNVCDTVSTHVAHVEITAQHCSEAGPLHKPLVLDVLIMDLWKRVFRRINSACRDDNEAEESKRSHLYFSKIQMSLRVSIIPLFRIISEHVTRLPCP